jgi:hypothetical protein
MRIILVFHCLLLVCRLTAQSGNTDHKRLLTGPAGVCIPLFGDGLHPAHPGDAFIIYRQDAAGASMKKIGSVQVPTDSKQIASRLTPAQWQAIRAANPSSSQAPLELRILQKNIVLPDSMMLSTSAWEAMGWIFVDRSIAGANQQIEYEVRAIHQNVEQTMYREKINPGEKLRYPGFKAYRKSYIDSNILLTWYTLDKRFIQARLQVRDNNQRKLNGDGAVLTSYHRRDTLFMTYSGPLLPGQLVQATIQATDLAGNLGPYSDTLRLMAAGLPLRRQIDSLRVADTLNSISLAWKALPATAQYAGIRILKSRSPDGPFVTLDSLPASASFYRDLKVVPGTQYYYVLHPILTETNSSVEPALSTIAAVASGHKSDQEMPQQLQLMEQADGTLRISWKPVSSLDADAYYVLRGSRKDSLTIISNAIRDTVFIDSLQNLDPAATTHYAVMALKSNMEWSDTSHVVSIQAKRGRFVPAPGGLSVRSQGMVSMLIWEDVRVKDPSVAGYIIYRRKPGEKSFTRISDRLVNGNEYQDSIGVEGSWEYAAASADYWGNQSFLSPTGKSLLTDNGKMVHYPGFTLAKQLNGIEITLLKQSHLPDPKTRYRLYRRVANPKELPVLIAELTAQDRQWLDTKAPTGKLLVYQLKVMMGGKE